MSEAKRALDKVIERASKAKDEANAAVIWAATAKDALERAASGSRRVADLERALRAIVDDARDQGRDDCMDDLVDEQFIEEARIVLEGGRPKRYARA